MKGVVVKFDNQRGYGFIRPDNGGRDVFVHISQVEGRQELEVGQRVKFQMRDAERGPSAYAVIPGRKARPPAIQFSLVTLVLVLSGTLLLYSLFDLHWLLGWFVSATVVAFALFGIDKQSARMGRRRVPELVLHGIAFAGGSFGALMGMRVFHHKTAKRQFRIVMWLIVLVQCAIALYLRWG